MVDEVLQRQAEALADRTGKPIESAMQTVLNSEAGKQLRGLRDGPHAQEGVQEWQVAMAQERAQERAQQLGERYGRAPEHPTHG
jgi:uncharacterized protein with PIN domain